MYRFVVDEPKETTHMVVLVLGRICALNIADKKTSIRSVPFFWTVLFGKSLRYTGNRMSSTMQCIPEERIVKR